jgi:hypothetical protein
MLDYFDWYRLGENGYTYETSEYDKLYGPFTSLLCDVQRMIGKETGVQLGLYVKPNRGGTIAVQRALSALARGAKTIYWYTYGPEWNTTDSFCAPPFLMQVSKADRIIAAGEEATFDSSPAVPAQVAWVSARPAQVWGDIHPWPEREWFTASWEDAKWTYVALQHAHMAIDTLDDVMVEKSDLAQYKVMYVVAPMLTRAASKKVEEWVKAGGTLYTSAWGLVYDEARRPNDVLQPVLGLARREPPLTWRAFQGTPVTKAQDFDDILFQYADAPADGMQVKGSGILGGAFTARLGREVLHPDAGTDVLARFADGAAAATCHAYGAGKAYVTGLWPGVEYTCKVRARVFDMTRDYDPVVLNFATAPAKEKVQPVVNVSAPCVDGTLLKNDKTARQAVVLANWTSKTTHLQVRERNKVSSVEFKSETVALQNVRVEIRGAGPLTKATSAYLRQALPVERSGNRIAVTLPRLEEGDILLLE